MQPVQVCAQHRRDAVCAVAALSITHWIDRRAEARMAALSGQLEQGVTYTKFFKVPDAFGILLFSRKLYFPNKNDF